MPEYIIRDAEGVELRRETTVNDVIGPFLRGGETAHVAEAKPPAAKAAPRAEPAPAPKRRR